jgi:hypothetical protein
MKERLRKKISILKIPIQTNDFENFVFQYDKREEQVREKDKKYDERKRKKPIQ